MMILTAKVDFKKIMVILLSLAAVLLALILIFGGKSQDTAATGTTGTNDSRVKFLEGFGWQILCGICRTFWASTKMRPCA